MAPSLGKRARLAYATTSDALVFIQESSSAEQQTYWSRSSILRKRARLAAGMLDDVDRYDGSAVAAATWAVTHDFVERRLRRDSLLRAFVAANVASATYDNRNKAAEDADMHSESASRTLLKLKCEPLPVRCAELLLRGNDAWQVRLSLLPPIFDRTNDVLAVPRGKFGAGDVEKDGQRRPDGLERSRGVKRCREDMRIGASIREATGDTSGNLWSVGVACVGSTLTFTYPSANAASVRSFFRDLTRARTAAALARGVPISRFYKVMRRSPVRIVVGIGPFTNVGREQRPQYTATVEYVYSRGNSGGFSMTFSPATETMLSLAPLIEEALDASGGQVGGILAGLLERACPVAAAADSAVKMKGRGRVRFVTALRVRALFQGGLATDAAATPGAQVGAQQGGQLTHCVDMDARDGGGLVKVIDVGRATTVMVQQGLAQRAGGGYSSQAAASGSQRPRGSEFAPLTHWDSIIQALSKTGAAQMQKAGSTVIVKMEHLEQFLTDLVEACVPTAAAAPAEPDTAPAPSPAADA
jgi:hypothetical protein